MQYFCCFLAFLTFSILAVNGQPAGNNDFLSISSGTSFGKCIGHCQQSINRMPNPSQVIVSRQANFDQASYPPINLKCLFTTTEWNDLAALVNLENFQSLDDRIGCLGCADGEAEWIQIDWTSGSKRLTFERRQTIKGFEGLVEKLREMRRIYLNKM